MAISNYTDVISLNDAKIYLRIDDTLTSDDNFITGCINAAFQWIEQYTNHIIKGGIKTYYKDNAHGCSEFTIYDYPIVSIENTSFSSSVRQLRTVVTTEDDTVTATMGYDSASDVPAPIIQAAYEILQSWYYNSDKPMQTTLVPDSVKFALQPYRRFLC